MRRDLRRLLPRLGGAATPLEDISARAALAGLEVTRFQPGTARAGEHYEEIPVELEFRGTFHDFLRFLELSAGVTASERRRPRYPDSRHRERAHDPPHRAGDGDAAIAARRRRGRRGGGRRRGDTDAGSGSGTAARTGGSRSPATGSVSPLSGGDSARAGDAARAGGGRATALRNRTPRPDSMPRGIAWGPGTPVALVNEGDGTGHVVQPGSSLGVHPYRVRGITPCEVIVEPIHNRGDRSSETRLKLPRCADPSTHGGACRAFRSLKRRPGVTHRPVRR